MLVLTRKLGEKILIDSEIEITVLEIRGGKVRLGFQAPHDVSIRRFELDLRSEPTGPVGESSRSAESLAGTTQPDSAVAALGLESRLHPTANPQAGATSPSALVPEFIDSVECCFA